MMGLKNVIGLDAGATHTKVVVWKMGEKVFEVTDWPGMNMDLINKGQNLEVFTQKLTKLSMYANYSWVLAVAGLDDWEEIKEAEAWWRRFLTSQGIVFKAVYVMSDIELVIWAGDPKGTGVGLIAGTGSNCLGIDHTGRRFKVGGMSHLMSDEGSGFALGWQVLRIVTKMYDGRLPKTGFLKKILDMYQARSVVELKNRLLKADNWKVEIARSSQLLLEMAASGDQLAEEVAKKEVLELVEMVMAVNRQTRENGWLPLTVAGSLFRSGYYFDTFKEEMGKVYPDQKITFVSPIEGILNYWESQK